MPLTEYTFPARNIRISRRMRTPKRITELYKGWFKQVRATMPEVPACGEGRFDADSGWMLDIDATEVSRQWIRFILVNQLGNRAYVVIDRTAPSIG